MTDPIDDDATPDVTDVVNPDSVDKPPAIEGGADDPVVDPGEED